MNMKKMLSLALAGVMALSLMACSAQNGGDSSENTSSPGSNQSGEETQNNETPESVTITSLNANKEAAELEARLLRWDLNLLANYLRTEAPKLTSSEISELQATVRDITYFLARLREGGSFCSERKLDTSIYMDSLLEAPAAKQ